MLESDSYECVCEIVKILVFVTYYDGSFEYIKSYVGSLMTGNSKR